MVDVVPSQYWSAKTPKSNIIEKALVPSVNSNIVIVPCISVQVFILNEIVSSEADNVVPMYMPCCAVDALQRSA